MKVSRQGRYLQATNCNEAELKKLDTLGFGTNQYGSGVTALYSEPLLSDVLHAFPFAELDADTRVLLQPSVRWNDVKGIDLPSLRTPRDFQRVGAQLLMQEERFILAWEVGVGKTKPIVDVATYLMKRKDADITFVFSEPNIAQQWATASIIEDSGLPAIYIWSRNGTERKRMLKKAVADGYKFIVMDYYVTRVDNFMVYLSKFITAKSILVFDEIQNLKDVNTQRFKQFYTVTKQSHARWVFGATGSPVSQALEDFYGEAAMIRDTVFGPPSRWFSFRAQFLILNPNNKHHVVGYRNVPDFMRKLHSITHRLRKEDVLDLPELIMQDHQMDMPADLRKIYDAYIDSDGILTLPGQDKPLFTAELPMTRVEKARQICQGFVYNTTEEFDEDTGDIKATRKVIYLLGDNWHNPKLDMCDTLIAYGYPILFWYAYDEEKRQLQRHFAKKDYEFLTLSSDVPNPQRPDIVSDYQKGKAQILLSHPRIGGAGLNLQRARINAFYGHQSRVVSREQAEGRSYRQGVTHPVTIYDLSWRDSVERTVLKQLRAKRELARMVVDTQPEDFRRLLRGDVTL